MLMPCGLKGHCLHPDNRMVVYECWQSPDRNAKMPEQHAHPAVSVGKPLLSSVRTTEYQARQGLLTSSIADQYLLKSVFACMTLNECRGAAYLVLCVDSFSLLLVLVGILLCILDHAVHLITAQSGCACDLNVLLLACTLVCRHHISHYKSSSWLACRHILPLDSRAKECLEDILYGNPAQLRNCK